MHIFYLKFESFYTSINAFKKHTESHCHTNTVKYFILRFKYAFVCFSVHKLLLVPQNTLNLGELAPAPLWDTQSRGHMLIRIQKFLERHIQGRISSAMYSPWRFFPRRSFPLGFSPLEVLSAGPFPLGAFSAELFPSWYFPLLFFPCQYFP